MSAETTVEAKQPETSKVSPEKAKKRAVDHLNSLKKTAAIQRTSTMEIGWQARLMKASDEFAILGMDEIEVMQAVNMERSTWFRSIQIAEGYKELKKVEYLKLYSGKAYIGLKLPESERYKKHWLLRMQDPKLSTDDFEDMVLKKIESGEVKQDATSVEERVWLKVRMYKKDHEACESALEEFCSEHDLGTDWGQALRIILTDKEQSKLSKDEIKMLHELKDAFKVNMPELLATLKLLKDAKRPAEDRCEAFEKAGMKFVRELSKAAGVKV